jgi:hypothetical protein
MCALVFALLLTTVAMQNLLINTALDMLIKGVPHDQPEVDAERQSLLVALELQVLREQNARQLLKPVPLVPAGLVSRLRQLWLEREHVNTALPALAPLVATSSAASTSLGAENDAEVPPVCMRIRTSLPCPLALAAALARCAGSRLAVLDRG